MFASPAPLPGLIAWCRALRHSLNAGLTAVRAFRQQAKGGPRVLRPVAADLADRLERGDTLEDALEPERNRFPPLFVSLVGVGERTGRLDQTLLELERYFETSLAVRREFIRVMMYPALQYAAAVAVISLLIFIMGVIAEVRGGQPVDVTGFGLAGATGAVVFLTVFGGGALAAAAAVTAAAQTVRWRARLEALALWVPGWGGAAQAFALQRFCLAMQMTAEAGLKASQCLKYAFAATANARFQAAQGRAVAVVKRGDELLDALRAAGVFPESFLEAVAVAEETGNVSEVMAGLSENYREDAVLKLKLAAQFTGYAVYALVAVFIIVAIFKIASIYLNAINAAAGP